MGQLVRRFCACETGTALTEYGMLIALMALGLVAALGSLRDSLGDLTNRTAVTISEQSSRGYGYGAAAPAPSGRVPSVPETPVAPDSSGGDSSAVAATSGLAAAEGR